MTDKTNQVCSAPAVRSEASAYFSDERHAAAAEAMANAANDFTPKAVCGGRWKSEKKRQKLVEKQLKRAAKEQLYSLGFGWWEVLWIVLTVFKWFTNKYLG